MTTTPMQQNLHWPFAIPLQTANSHDKKQKQSLWNWMCKLWDKIYYVFYEIAFNMFS
jgi:hypothetical protein